MRYFSAPTSAVAASAFSASRWCHSRQGARVVLAPALDVVDLEADRLHRLQRVADVVELEARKHVFLHQPPLRGRVAEAAAACPCPPRDAVVEQQPAVAEQPGERAEIARIVGDADMLVHADRGDLVVLPGDVLVAAELDRDLALEPQPLHLGERVVVLLLESVTPCALTP